MPIAQMQFIGLQGTIAYDSADNPASPTWVQITHKIDVQLGLAWGEIDASDASNDWELFEKALLSGSLTAQYRKHGASDAVFDWFLAALMSRVPKHIAFFRDDATDLTASGTYKGYRMIANLFQANEAHPLKDKQMLDMIWKPAQNSDSLPEQYSLTVI